MGRNKEKRKIYEKQYNLIHKKEKKQYREQHKEQIKNYCKLRYRKHKYPDSLKSGLIVIIKEMQTKKTGGLKVSFMEIKTKSQREEQHRRSSQRYRLKNPDKIRAYRHSTKGRYIKKQGNIKRQSFGFVPLNQWFEDSEGHHINREQVIYIPKDMHRNIKHSVLRNTNMDTINKLALCWLAQTIL